MLSSTTFLKNNETMDASRMVGHESVETTQIYLHADLRQKEEALAKVTPLDMPPGAVPA